MEGSDYESIAKANPLLSSVPFSHRPFKPHDDNGRRSPLDVKGYIAEEKEKFTALLLDPQTGQPVSKESTPPGTQEHLASILEEDELFD